MNYSCDFLVIGTGLAGLYYALKAAESGKVILISKGKLENCNSVMAQGGIASVTAKTDSFEKHIEDTLSAGAGLCDLEMVRIVVEEGPKAIEELQKWGVKFDLEENGELALGKEAAHSERRVLHIQDHTGKDVHKSLLQKALQHPNIEFQQECYAIDLLTSKKLFLSPQGGNRCYGAYVFDIVSGRVHTVSARFTVLATGGAGKIYLYTSNWEGATGDGIAMAYRAGARVANLEFMQFHPTCLYHPEARNFLITEALRGEGAQLINRKSEYFMNSKHPLGSLAPRDIVARGIDEELKSSGAECVYLELPNKDKDYLTQRFPSIYEKCMELGIDITKDPIPVVPAAHYLCGGVLTNSLGQTDIDGLFAVGETACTGLHGANRLASNSLLECCVLAKKAAQFCIENQETYQVPQDLHTPPWKYHNRQDKDEMIVISHIWEEVRRLMWNYVGILRSNKRLHRAQQRLEAISHEVKEYYWDFKMNRDVLELRNIALVASLSVQCALKRKESRGIHYNIDYPQAVEEEAFNTIVG